MIGDEYFQLRARLGAAIQSLQQLAGDLQAPAETAATLGALTQSLNEPFLFVVVGEVKAGKSSLLNALFGREFCKVDVLPATDRVYVFKFGETERNVQINERLTECHRDAEFLLDFNLVDTPGTNTIVAEHQTITEQFLPLADLVLFVFSATNPWAASGWDFLKFIHKRWLKRVAFVVQQADLRSAEEIAAIVKHLGQTMLERLGQACPIFAVSARSALAAKQAGGDLAPSGFAALEGYIDSEVARGEARLGKLRSVCQTSQVVLRDLGTRVRESIAVIERDTRRLEELHGTLAERKEQSRRQIDGILFTLSQSYDKAQARGEELLHEKLTLGATFKLIFSRGDWRHDFQSKVEDQLREAVQRQIENSLELLESDLRSVWRQLHELLQKNFAEESRGALTLPDYVHQRGELLRRLELTLLERGSSQQVEQQLGKLFQETAAWLRVPAGVAAAGGLATLVAAMAKLAILDVTGTVAGVAAVVGTFVAVVRRQKILNEFRRQMAEKKESVLAAFRDHLHHDLDRFYLELGQTFQPLRAFCTAQAKRYEPMLTRLAAIEAAFSKLAAELQEQARAEQG